MIAKSLLKILIGLIILIVPLYLIFPGMPLETWGNAVLELIKGGITFVVLLIGIILILLGLTDIKN